MAIFDQPRRFLGADAVRALALLCVIAIHADHWPLQDAGADRAVWSGVDQLARVAVPWFVMLSGCLLAYQERGPARAFLGRRLGRSLVPWAAWVPVYALVGLFLTAEIPHDWADLGGWLELGAGHLWFLVLIPQLYLVALVWPRTPRGTALAGAAALLVQVGVGIYRLYAPGDGPLQGVLLPFGFELGVCWIGYFGVGAALGARLARGSLRWPAWPFWLMVPPAAWLVLWVGAPGAANPSFLQGTGAFLNPALPLIAVPSFVAVALTGDRVLAAHGRLRAVTVRLSELSLGVYIVHEALLYVPGRLLAPLLQRDLPVSLVGFGLLVAVALGLSAVATRLLVATPLAVTLGSRRSARSRLAARRLGTAA
ncbi:MAG: acyltransferase [bacterium]|nr:acyltransferase [bacterium]